MDHIAYTIGKDPLEVRLANIDKQKEIEITDYINDVMKWADVDSRKKDVANFNKVKGIILAR